MTFKGHSRSPEMLYFTTSPGLLSETGQNRWHDLEGGSRSLAIAQFNTITFC